MKNEKKDLKPRSIIDMLFNTANLSSYIRNHFNTWFIGKAKSIAAGFLNH